MADPSIDALDWTPKRPRRAPRAGARAHASARADAEGRPPGGVAHHLWCFLRQWRVTHALWLALAAIALGFAASGSSHDTWIATSAFGLALLPAAVEGLVGVRLPRGFVLACGLFTVLTVMLGELTDFYQRFVWWDVAMHVASGFVVGGIGLVGALVLLAQAGARRSVLLPALFALFTGLAVAAVWELFEFALDAGYGFSTQPGLSDTMHDIMLGGLGALAAAILGAVHLAGLPTGAFGRLIDGAVGENAPFPGNAPR